MSTDITILQERAINEALNGHFQKAIDFNKEIVRADSNNLEAYLRLGFASFQINDFKNAHKYYLKALKIQPANQIAKINLDKLKILGKRSRHKVTEKNTSSLDPNLFLNVIGKTKVVPLVNLGQINLLAKLKVGQRVYLKIKKRRVEIRNENNEYIGALPDDISKRLIFFIEAGSHYIAYIKEAAKNQVDVFLKEEKKGKKVERYSSFPRNIQDDLKIMSVPEGDEDNLGVEKTPHEEAEEDGKEKPVDIEALAEEIEEKEYYPENAHFKEDKEDFEE